MLVLYWSKSCNANKRSFVLQFAVIGLELVLLITIGSIWIVAA